MRRSSLCAAVGGTWTINVNAETRFQRACPQQMHPAFCSLSRLFFPLQSAAERARAQRNSPKNAARRVCTMFNVQPSPPLIPLVWVHCGDTELEKYCEFEGGETVLSTHRGEVHHWRRAPLQHLCCPYESGFIRMIQSARFCALMYFKQAHLPPPSDLETYIKHEASNTPTAFNARKLFFFFFCISPYMTYSCVYGTEQIQLSLQHRRCFFRTH